MNNTLSNMIIFTVGAVLGSTVTWKLIKSKYEQIVKEELDSIRKSFKTDDEEELSTDTNFTELKNIIESNGYTNYSNTNNVENKEDEMEGPYVIPPEEFDENDYQTESLTYWADKVLTDDYGNIIEDVESLVGEDSLTHFGEYEDDSVFVRNDLLQVDFEILIDTRNYHDVFPEYREEGYMNE